MVSWIFFCCGRGISERGNGPEWASATPSGTTSSRAPASARLRAASISASSSSRNFSTIEPIGIAIASPSTHRQLPMICSCTEAMMSRSIGVASPDWIRSSILTVQFVPSRHGHALAARLMGVELGHLHRHLEHGVRVVDDDDRARAEHRSRLGHAVEVVGEVEIVPGQHRCARAAREPELDLAALGRPAGQAVDDLPRRGAELDLVVARPLHVAGHRHQLGAGRGLGAELGVLLAAHPEDVGNGGQRLDVVDQRRAVVQALDGGEGRLQARVAALALERVEQAGLLAADVGAGAPVEDEADRQVRAEDPLAQVAGFGRLGDRRLEDVGLVGVLARGCR